jgi:hypothetical protein
MAGQTHQPAWPYDVLAQCPVSDLLAVDDAEAWQQHLALKLLKAADTGDELGDEVYWRRRGVLAARNDAVVLAARHGVDARDLGLHYPPLQRLIDERAATISAWVATHIASHTRHDMLTALAYVRRHAVPCEPDAGPTQWVLPPSLLGGAEPCASGGLEHFVEHGVLIIRAGSGGLSEDEPLERKFGRRSNDDQMLEYGVCVLGNPAETYVIHEMAEAAVVAWERHNAACTATGDDGSSRDEEAAREMRLRAAEISAFAGWPGETSAVLLRDADSIGPCWPGVPGPNLCDIHTLVLSRWLTAPRELLTAHAGSTPPAVAEGEEEEEEEGSGKESTAQEWGRRVSAALRQPLPVEQELLAWRCLLCLLESELSKRPTAEADEQQLLLLRAAILPQPGSEPEAKPEGKTKEEEEEVEEAGPAGQQGERLQYHDDRSLSLSSLEFRLDKTKLLASAVMQLRSCLAASSASSGISLQALRQPEEGAGQGGGYASPVSSQGLPVDLEGLSDEFIAQAVRMPPVVRTLLLTNGSAPTSSRSVVSPAQLLRALRLPENTYRAALCGVRGPLEHTVLREQAVLPPGACAALRKAVDEAVLGGQKPHGADTVDGAPDFQLNLRAEQLQQLIGVGGMASLGGLAQRFEETGGGGRGGGGGLDRSYFRDSSITPAVEADGGSGAQTTSPRAVGASKAALCKEEEEYLHRAEAGEGLEVFIRRYNSAGRCAHTHLCPSSVLSGSLYP